MQPSSAPPNVEPAALVSGLKNMGGTVTYDEAGCVCIDWDYSGPGFHPLPLTFDLSIEAETAEMRREIVADMWRVIELAGVDLNALHAQLEAQ